MPGLRDALRDLPEAVFADILESDEAYLLVLDLPGATAETVDVTIEDGHLKIEGRRRKDVSREFRFVSEDRSLFLDVDVPLPPNAAGHEAEATVDRGTLEVRVPKQSAASETTVPVSEA